MAELSVFVDFVPKKGNPTRSSQHQTSCHWFDWKFNKDSHAQQIEKLHENSTRPPMFASRLKKLTNRRQAEKQLIESSRREIQFGDANACDIFCFSQHDNRHQIEAPAKKTITDVVHHQAKSNNITATMFWKNPNNSDITKSSITQNIQRQSYTADAYNSMNKQSTYRRFPKKHRNVLNKRSKSNILAHNENNTGLEDKNSLISLQILAQPQSYTGSRLDINKSKTSPGWCYSVHGKTFSKHVSNATKHACYRF